jgi:flavin-dependent dehydrogenase
VILLDAASMPRPKVCGCCLSRTAMEELLRLEATDGGSSRIAARVLPLQAVTLAGSRSRARIAMKGGGTLSRERLDAALVCEAVVAGAAWLPETHITAVEDGATGVVIHGRRDGGRIAVRADVAVIASGLGGAVRIAGRRGHVAAGSSRLGIGAVLPPGAFDLPTGELLMAIARGGYCGLVRLEDGRVDLAAAIDRDLLSAARSPAEAVAAILAESLGPEAMAAVTPWLAEATVRGTPPLTHAAGPVAGKWGRMLRIGDAAGYVEPFTGEGMGWALASARLLDEAIDLPSFGTLGDAATRYATAYRHRFATHHARCRSVARAVRRPLVVACVAAVARAFPGVAARALPIVVGAATTAEAAA